jgi:hypothetical protein
MNNRQSIFFLVGILMFLVIFGAIPAMSGYKIVDDFSEPVAKYVFGFDKANIDLVGSNLSSYAIIVTYLMLWLIIFVTFGDIIETFSSFDATIAWVIAFALAIVGGMSGVISGGLIWLTDWLVFAGTAAVYIALGVAFFLFLAVQFGATSIKGWIERRKALMQAVKGESGARRVASAVRNLQRTEESFEAYGDHE